VFEIAHEGTLRYVSQHFVQFVAKPTALNVGCQRSINHTWQHKMWLAFLHKPPALSSNLPYLLTYLFTYLKLLTYFITYLHTYLLTYLLNYLLHYLLTYLLIYLLNYLLHYLLTY